MLKRAGIALIALGLLTISGWYAAHSQEDQPQAQESQRPTASDQRGTESSPAIIKILPPEDAEAKAKQEAADRAAKEQLDWNTIKLGILGIVVAFLQFVAIGVQAFFLWWGIDESKKALIATQRAFVFINSFENKTIRDIQMVLPKWENSGSTPTKTMTMWASWAAFTEDMPKDFSFPDYDKDGKPRKEEPLNIFLGPKATIYAEVLKIPVAIIDRARRGHLKIFIWGWANYEDVFGGAHRTEFCNEIVVTGVDETKEMVKVMMTFALYRRHNSAA